MKLMRVELKNNKENFCNVKIAENFLDRLIGLMFCSEKHSYPLMLRPCNSIHTFFMQFAIDVYFIDKKNIVIKKIANMRPWDITGLYFKSHAVLEIPSKKATCNFEVGDEIKLCIN
jgi:uncharacterized membrane protein (UPF0127 family)